MTFFIASSTRRMRSGRLMASRYSAA